MVRYIAKHNVYRPGLGNLQSLSSIEAVVHGVGG